MKHLTFLVLFIFITPLSNAEVSGGYDCKSALQGFDASHNKLTKLASEIGRSDKVKKSKANELISELKKAIENGNNALRLCAITGKDKEQFDGYHNMAKSTLAFYKSQGLAD